MNNKENLQTEPEFLWAQSSTLTADQPRPCLIAWGSQSVTEFHKRIIFSISSNLLHIVINSNHLPVHYVIWSTVSDITNVDVCNLPYCPWCCSTITVSIWLLQLFHPYVMDTSVSYNLRGMAHSKTSLKRLTAQFLRSDLLFLHFRVL